MSGCGIAPCVAAASVRGDVLPGLLQGVSGRYPRGVGAAVQSEYERNLAGVADRDQQGFTVPESHPLGPVLSYL